MKKLLILSLVPLSFSTMKAQNEYFQHDPSWTVMEIRSQSYPCVTYDTVTFYLNGDTVINSLTYKKLYAQGTGYNMWWSMNPNFNCNTTSPHNYMYAGYTGCLRSDSGRVYFIHAQFASEDQIYDFNLNVGDTIPVFNWTSGLPWETVAYIDSVYTPYGYLRKFHLTSDTTQFLLEGGASSYGLFHYVGVMMDFSSYLMCYSLNDSAWWPAPGPECGAILLGTDAVVPEKIELEVVPNPATSVVNITAPVTGTIEIINQLGQVVFTQSFAEQKMIDISTFAPGIYMVRLVSDQGTITSRLLIE